MALSVLLTPYRWMIAYFFILIILGLLLPAPELQPPWASSLFDAAKFINYGDPNTFGITALEISQHGWVKEESKWVFNLWPPGFILLEAGIFKLFGVTVPVLLLLVLSAALFACVLEKLRCLYLGYLGSIAYLVPLLFFSFPLTHIFLLKPKGLVFGEFLAIGCFLLAILLLLNQKLKSALIAGSLFAVAAYMRSQFEFFLAVLGVITILAIVVLNIRSRFFKMEKRMRIGGFKHILAAILIAQLLMLPWRIYHYSEGHGLKWVTTHALWVANSLSTDEMLQARGGSFVIRGAGNVACRLAPEHCGKSDASIYLQIFLEHPIKWVTVKLKTLPNYWFASLNKFTYPHGPPDYFFNWIYFFSFVGMLILHWKTRHIARVGNLHLITAAILLAHVVIVIFSHFEVRYFFFIKMYSVSLCLILLPMWRAQKSLMKSKCIIRVSA